MTDYRRMLRLAGLNESEVVRIASEAEAVDAQNAEQDDAEDKFAGFEKLIALHCRKTGLELDGNHGIFINDDQVELTLSPEANGIALAQLLDFANKLAADGVGQNIKVSGNSNGSVVLNFDLLS